MTFQVETIDFAAFGGLRKKQKERLHACLHNVVNLLFDLRQEKEDVSVCHPHGDQLLGCRLVARPDLFKRQPRRGEQRAAHPRPIDRQKPSAPESTEHPPTHTIKAY